MRVDELLRLAVCLATIDYYLGLLLFAAPLPMQVKRFGLRMAYHGVSAALLASLYTTIVYGVEYLLSVLGVSWNNLVHFYDEATAYSASFYGLAAGLMLSRPYLVRELPQYAKGVVGLLVSSASKSLSRASLLIAVSEAAVKVLASFVLSYWPVLLVAGIVLYAVPGGLGRRLGASLIASAIVLYLGLPFLPYWVDMWLYAVKNANPIAALVLGGSPVKLYLLWGYVNMLLYDSRVSVVLWRGGVPMGFETSLEYHFFYPLPPGAYHLSVYAGPIRLWDRVILVPDACKAGSSPPTNIITLFELLFAQLLRGGMTGCEYDIRVSNAVVVADHLVVIGYDYYPLRVEYNASGSGVDAVIALGGVSGGAVRICYGCGCSVYETNATGEVGAERVGCAVCKLYRLSGDNVKIYVHIAECSSPLSASSPRGGLAASLLSLILHDIPLAFYMVALGFAMGVWSFLILLSLAIYGFGRVLGESTVLVLRLRY